MTRTVLVNSGSSAYVQNISIGSHHLVSRRARRCWRHERWSQPIRAGDGCFGCLYQYDSSDVRLVKDTVAA